MLNSNLSKYQPIGTFYWGDWLFTTYALEATFQNFPGVYIFSNNSDNAHPYCPTYIGQSSKVGSNISRHKSDSVEIIRKSNQIHVLEVPDEATRREIKNILIGVYKPT